MAANNASTAAAAANVASAAANVAANVSAASDAVRSRDWMFCPVTGALLELDAERGVAWSPVSGFERRLEGKLDLNKEEALASFFFLLATRARKNLDLDLDLNASLSLSSHLKKKKKQTSTPCPSSARQTSTTTAGGTSSLPWGLTRSGKTGAVTEGTISRRAARRTRRRGSARPSTRRA